MWNGLKTFLLRTALCFLLVFCCCCSSIGYTRTQTETSQFITIQISQWQNLMTELNFLNSDLMECQQELSRLKKPSTELLSELAEAQAMLSKLTKELDEQKNDLNLLSKEVNELKTLSQTLKEQINKERRVHRRQIWQNRIWCFVIGFGVGYAVAK